MIDNNAFISFLKFVSESGLQAHWSKSKLDASQ